MAKPKWGVTFKPGEFEALQRELFPDKTPVPLQQAANIIAPARTLFRAHSCSVTFPDGKVGDCTYERKGPTWHLFHYFYPGQFTRTNDSRQTGATALNDRAELNYQVHSAHLDHTPAAVEAKARELAAKAYERALEAERQYYFARASPDLTRRPPRVADKTRFTTDAKTAKDWGGHYAICRTGLPYLRLYGLPIYEKIERVNHAWETGRFQSEFGEEGDARSLRLVVGCFNRLDRCWELPFYNPLYACWDLRETFTQYLPAYRIAQLTPSVPPTTDPKG